MYWRLLQALEEKEAELNNQLLKLADIEEENAMQRVKIDKLEEQQDEGGRVQAAVNVCTPPSVQSSVYFNVFFVY